MWIEEDVALGPLTSLRIGGPARWLARVTREEDLPEVLAFAREKQLPIFVLGGGSNLIVPDAGYAGLVVQVAISGEIVADPVDASTRVRYRVPAGTDWDSFVRHTCTNSHGGVECLAGIPGTVGGSPVQNIGAYGQDVSQTIHSVRVWDRNREDFRELPARDCGFSYRQSIFNRTEKGRHIVTAVIFDLQSNFEPRLEYADLQRHFAGSAAPGAMEVYEAVRTIRARKGMIIDPEAPSPEMRSAGSFFKNPVVKPNGVKRIEDTMPSDGPRIPHWPLAGGEVKLAAAWLIEQAGFARGFTLGRVGISPRHTLALINRTGDATCEDLFRLRNLIQATVEDRFGVTLEQEPVMLA